jgi:hypothetical protein
MDYTCIICFKRFATSGEMMKCVGSHNPLYIAVTPPELQRIFSVLVSAEDGNNDEKLIQRLARYMQNFTRTVK